LILCGDPFDWGAQSRQLVVDRYIKLLNSLLFYANARVTPRARLPVSMGYDGDAIIPAKPRCRNLFWLRSS